MKRHSKAKSAHHRTPKKAAKDTPKGQGLVEVGALVTASSMTALSQAFLLGARVFMLPLTGLRLLTR